MPEERLMERVRRDKRLGKSAATQAGEFVREEMEHVKRGKHGSASRKQTIAIGLSKARKAGVAVPAQSSKHATKKAAAQKTAAPKTVAKKAARKAAPGKPQRMPRASAVSRGQG